MNELGNYIRKKREEKDLSLRDFASLCGLSHSYIDSIEKGADPRTGKPVSPTIDAIEKIAKGLGLSIFELIKLIKPDAYTEAVRLAEEPPSYKTRTPDTDSIFQAKTLADAIIRIEKMRREFNLSKEWMYEMWDKAIEVYGQLEGKGGVAAHGPSYPGSGALDGGDEPR